jgi:hypothetical protein
MIQATMKTMLKGDLRADLALPEIPVPDPVSMNAAHNQVVFDTCHGLDYPL